jgi:uncharacterized membrane protein YkvI
MMRRAILIAQVAMTYMGTVIGAGFATGQGTIQFFTAYGFYGYAAILICTLLFIWLGTKMMLISARIGAFSYEELNLFLFGPFFGKAANLIVFVILFGTTVVMLAGAGSIFEERLGASYIAGIAATAALTYVVMRRQLQGILAVNSIVVPMMLLFTALIGIHTLRSADFTSWHAVQTGTEQHWRWLVSSLSYAALNLAMVEAVLVPLGGEVKDEKVLKWGGIWGGIGLGLMLVVSHTALLSKMPEIMEYAIPMAEVIQAFGPVLYALFIVIVYGEIFTTLIGNVFGITRQIGTILHFSNDILVILILFGCFLISLIGFSSLLAYLYPLFGFVGIALLVSLMLSRIPK